MCLIRLIAFQRNGLCFSHRRIPSTSKLAHIKLFKSSTEQIHSWNYLTTQEPQLKPWLAQDFPVRSVPRTLNITQKKRGHSYHQTAAYPPPPSPHEADVPGWRRRTIRISSPNVQKVPPACWIKIPNGDDPLLFRLTPTPPRQCSLYSEQTNRFYFLRI